jgi:hypothetical protein
MSYSFGVNNNSLPYRVVRKSGHLRIILLESSENLNLPQNKFSKKGEKSLEILGGLVIVFLVTKTQPHPNQLRK